MKLSYLGTIEIANYFENFLGYGQHEKSTVYPQMTKQEFKTALTKKACNIIGKTRHISFNNVCVSSNNSITVNFDAGNSNSGQVVIEFFETGFTTKLIKTNEACVAKQIDQKILKPAYATTPTSPHSVFHFG